MRKIIVYLVEQEHNALLQLAQREMRVRSAMPREISLKNRSLHQPCADGMFRSSLPFCPWRIKFKKTISQITQYNEWTRYCLTWERLVSIMPSMIVTNG
jgi:hypothetical protein